MKGVVLTGGTGSRLNPLTRVTNAPSPHLQRAYGVLPDSDFSECGHRGDSARDGRQKRR